MTDPHPTADGSLTLHSARYGETYHSHHGALAEARHVYLDGAGLPLLLGQDRTVRVLEIGFGLGLNALLTLAQPGPATLTFTSLEHDLLPTAQLTALRYHTLLPQPEGLVERWLDARCALGDPPPSSADRTWELAPRRHLNLMLGDAIDTVHQLPFASFDAIYHDAFSPEANPELWTTTFLDALFQRIRPGGALVSYCVKGTVRRGLAASGFTVHKRPGPPQGKREVLTAYRPSDTSPV